MSETTQDINNTFETFNQNCSTLQPCFLVDMMKPKDTGSSIHVTKFCHKNGPHPTPCDIYRRSLPPSTMSQTCAPPQPQENELPIESSCHYLKPIHQSLLFY